MTHSIYDTGWSIIADAELRALRDEITRLRDTLEQIRQRLADGDDLGACLIARVPRPGVGTLGRVFTPEVARLREAVTEILREVDTISTPDTLRVTRDGVAMCRAALRGRT